MIEMKKENGVEGVKFEKMKKVGVFGGGLMGGGIVYVMLIKVGVFVCIKDVCVEGIVNVMKYSYDILNKKVKKCFMCNSEM